MPLTPEEIEDKEFFTALRGYDKREVDSFMLAIAADYASLLAAYEAARKQPKTPYENVGEEISILLQTARDSAESLLGDARTKASETLETATREAEQNRAGAQARARDIVADAEQRVTLLTQSEQELRRRLGELQDLLDGVRAKLDEPREHAGENQEVLTLDPNEGEEEQQTAEAAGGTNWKAESTLAAGNNDPDETVEATPGRAQRPG